MSDCRKCAEFSWCLENEDCGLFKQKPQTNADRIRSMTDEELRDWMADHVDCGEGCPAFHRCTIGDKGCEDWLMDWLKQEVAE